MINKNIGFEPEFIKELVSSFGGDIVTSTSVLYGEEAADVISAINKIAGLSKELKNATRRWVAANEAPDSCVRAAARAELVKEAEADAEAFKTIDIHVEISKVVDLAEAEADAESRRFFDLQAKINEARIAAQEKTELSVQSALKILEDRQIFKAICHKVCFVMLAIAKQLVKEYSNYSNDNYQVNIKNALRIAFEGGDRTFFIEKRLIFKGRYGVFNTARSILLEELHDANKFIFAKINKGKVVTATCIADLAHIKGKLYFATKEKSGSMVRSLKKVAKRMIKKVTKVVNKVKSIVNRGHVWSRV